WKSMPSTAVNEPNRLVSPVATTRAMEGHRTGTVVADMTVSGDGFVTLADGSQRWGRFGAAGILVRHVDDEGELHFFLALRSTWTHNGGTWAVPGGALNHGETPLEGALREFAEEIGHHLDAYEVTHTHEDDHGGWSSTAGVVDVQEEVGTPVDRPG